MAEDHVILLSNFYGTYLDKSRFKEVVVTNNAGIEQLATAGLEKVNEVKLKVSADDNIYVMIVAGLTDVIIKSVEDGKNKLEIAPDASTLLEKKMKWAQAMFTVERVKVIWVVMPPISLQMYHTAEGWDISDMPGMSSGLVAEQKLLNNIMLNYRFVCLNLNAKDGRKFRGPFFTGQVAELSASGTYLLLNTNLLQNDGISPTEALTARWAEKLNKFFSDLKENRQHSSQRSVDISRTGQDLGSGRKLGHHHRSESHGLSSGGRGIHHGRDEHSKSRTLSGDDEKIVNTDCVRKQCYDHGDDGTSSRGSRSMDLEREQLNGERDRRDYEAREHERHGYVSRSKIQYLEDASESLRLPDHYNNMAHASEPNTIPDTMVSAVQLLAATMHQLSKGNIANPFGALLDPQSHKVNGKAWPEQGQEQHLRKRIEEKSYQDMHISHDDQALEALRRENEKQQLLDRHLLAENVQHKMDAGHKLREELNIRERMRTEEKRQIEIQKCEDENMRIRAEREMDEIRELRGKQLKAHQLEQERRTAKNPGMAKPGSLNTSTSTAHSVQHYTQDAGWKFPAVLFSCVNRNKILRPLRGVVGRKVEDRSSKEQHEQKSRGHLLYNTVGTAPPVVSYLKVEVKSPGRITDYETKVADFNNRVMDLLKESKTLILEGQKDKYIVRREIDDYKRNMSPIPRNHKPRHVRVPATKRLYSSTENGQRQTRFDVSTHPAVSKSDKPKSSTSRTSTGRVKELPSAATKKPRWDRSDESEEELLYEDEDAKCSGSGGEEDYAKVDDISTNGALVEKSKDTVNGNGKGDDIATGTEHDGAGDDFIILDNSEEMQH